MLASSQHLIEGMIIASYAIRANHAFVYIRGEVPHVIRRMHAAVRDAYDNGYPSARTSSAPDSTSTSPCTAVLVRTSVVKKPRCSVRSKACAGSHV